MNIVGSHCDVYMGNRDLTISDVVLMRNHKYTLYILGCVAVARLADSFPWEYSCDRNCKTCHSVAYVISMYAQNSGAREGLLASLQEQP